MHELCRPFISRTATPAPRLLCVLILKEGMRFKRAMRNLIIGEGRYIDSFTEFKQIMLSGQFAIMAMVVLAINATLERSFTWALLTYVIAFVLLGSSIFLHRSRKHLLANYVMLITANFTAYLFASSESMQTGIFTFFIVLVMGAFSVFNHVNRFQAIFFSILGFVLFCLSSFGDFSILPWRPYSDEEIFLIAIVNVSTAIIATGLSVSLLISLNFESARRLSENNKLLIKTNSELDRFVYSTSHDLRAPLTSILGLINIAHNVSDINELKRYLTLMKGRVDSLDSFIKDITDYSRNNRKEVGSEHVKVKELACEVWEDLKFAPEASNIFFDVQIEDHVEVISDKSRLKVILSNLISNAVRYHDGRKDSQYIRLRYESMPMGFCLRVEDNGQGIAEEYHQKIFDMFYRGNESSKGSGLGLYIVKEMLEKLSGSITLDSKPGRGSSFTISLPVKAV